MKNSNCFILKRYYNKSLLFIKFLINSKIFNNILIHLSLQQFLEIKLKIGLNPNKNMNIN